MESNVAWGILGSTIQKPEWSHSVLNRHNNDIASADQLLSVGQLREDGPLLEAIVSDEEDEDPSVGNDHPTEHDVMDKLGSWSPDVQVETVLAHRLGSGSDAKWVFVQIRLRTGVAEVGGVEHVGPWRSVGWLLEPFCLT